MSMKYLGEIFDIYGGGNDFKFFYYENEIVQNMGFCNCSGVCYWMYVNMLLMNGCKMFKSDGNIIMFMQFFIGNSLYISKGYSLMVVKFFMLQLYYCSIFDLMDEVL